ncbi:MULTISPECIES: hypothetical protein [Clostridium]|uniref:Uncharacterized protein n=4 Tax=Clostridium TaxID=1485 RepID=D8GKS5_CLOLD|nr:MULTISPECIES: hypothetical protein [Clostridium]ADK13258.1 hypothetical protein CLJU_c01680 [Clostridium ljungdahlii DSM 13528]AGY76481.1 hypothetical protein CAETHG_2270 [Clostridium autoethanogenum DSM 10061]ALU36643.1 Hypothetical protein CLAU_2215 [Clostridium autoethanogenum DSM 10061]OAA88876.1 hypothetical protein WX45_02111 [Clostridium ljungdahlii DSM 13528]OAA91676.1 hypothetical protein WX73_01561 [Clostridium coskatii]
MKENTLNLAQRDIDEALSVIESLEKAIVSDSSQNQVLKDKFHLLYDKVNELENILKSEGII